MSMLGGNDPDLIARKRWASRFLPAKPKAGSSGAAGCLRGQLKPLYNYMADLPGIEGMPIPLISSRARAAHRGPRDQLRRRPRLPVPMFVLHDHQCPGTQIAPPFAGRRREDHPRKRRPGTAQFFHHRRQFRAEQGLGSDPRPDHSPARSREAEDRVPHPGGHALPQAAELYREMRARPDVRRVFIGLENINPDSLAGAHKRQNKITEYRKMLLAWKEARIITYCGYITRFPNDTPESIKRDVEIVKKELPLDILEFFFLTPLPGSEDHQKLVQAGVKVDPDLNKYDLNHVCAPHAKMSRAEWERAYRTAWETYYTMDHMETVLRRLMAKKGPANNAIVLMTWFMSAIHLEESSSARERRVPLEIPARSPTGSADRAAWTFYPKYWVESVDEDRETGDSVCPVAPLV